MKPSSNMQPVLKICEYGPMNELLAPLLNVERDEIGFDKIDYKSLSEDLKTGMSWVFQLFCDCTPDEETWGYVDPFQNLRNADSELKIKIIQALGVRYRIKIEKIRNHSGISGPKIAGLLFDSSNLGRILKVYENHGEINWSKIGYGGLSGGYQTAVSWVFSILNAKLPEEHGFRNPISNFGVMDIDLQEIILKALALSIDLEIY